MEPQKYRLSIISALSGSLGFVALLVAAVLLAHNAPGVAAIPGTGSVALPVKGFYALLQSLGE